VAYILKHSDPANSDSDTVKTGLYHHIWPILVPVAIFIGLVVYFYRRALRPENIQKSSPGIFLPKTFTVLEDGLLCRSEGGESMQYWKSVRRLVETEEDYFLMFAERNGHPFPKRSFPTVEMAALFANQVRLHLEKYAPDALLPR
jgi:hypothetical protein